MLYNKLENSTMQLYQGKEEELGQHKRYSSMADLLTETSGGPLSPASSTSPSFPTVLSASSINSMMTNSEHTSAMPLDGSLSGTTSYWSSEVRYD